MVVENLSEEIRECLRYAEEHARQAERSKQAKFTRGLSGNGAPVGAAGPQLPIRATTQAVWQARL